MNLWKYYDGDLKYPNLNKYKNKDIALAFAKFNPKNICIFKKI